MTSCLSPPGGTKAPRLPAESAAAEMTPGAAVTIDSTVSMPSPTSSEAPSGGPAEAHGASVDAAERLARGRDVRLGGQARIEPGALHAVDGAVVAGHGGDQRRKTAQGRAFAIAKLGMEAQCREPAAREPAGVEVGFGMGAADGAATPPEAAGRFCCVVALARRRRSRQGEEGAGLGERRAKRPARPSDAGRDRAGRRALRWPRRSTSRGRRDRAGGRRASGRERLRDRRRPSTGPAFCPGAGNAGRRPRRTRRARRRCRRRAIRNGTMGAA